MKKFCLSLCAWLLMAGNAGAVTFTHTLVTYEPGHFKVAKYNPNRVYLSLQYQDRLGETPLLCSYTTEKVNPAAALSFPFAVEVAVPAPKKQMWCASQLRGAVLVTEGIDE